MASEQSGTSAPTNTVNHRDASGSSTADSKRGWSWALICGLFSLVGAIMLVTIALPSLVHEVQLQRDCTELTDGIVTQLVLNPADESDDDSSDTWTPVFRYSVNGQSYEQKSSVASSPPRYKVGQAVAVLYDPADPSRYIVKGDNAASVLWSLLVMMCLAFTAVFPVALMIHKANNPGSRRASGISSAGKSVNPKSLPKPSQKHAGPSVTPSSKEPDQLPY
ncbi:DUF3592 domain-containing protein [Bifidobacterium miconisargentati]|uniref:DUF3592 domain-containing protein n=1 Tax=Bifidobacterium miconisargentati TaxID=2834437 RepID=UPI001BDBDB15|nr:DUF3592 domain-containing protein [Bifidobacterium miconisargentati]MBW3091192.1 DUF3592 domain-containing protein [Bifidobacterium miconisargentati]